MATQDLVIFDTCTLPEYYSDVHKILSLPRGYVVTYDYSARNIDEKALPLLRESLSSKQPRRALLAYMQEPDYKKGDPSLDDAPLSKDAFATLTRLAEVVSVRELSNNNKYRYYLDLRLLGYPFDRHQAIANDIINELRKSGSIPFKTYIAVCPDTAIDALFQQNVSDEQGFSTVVDALSADPSQFCRDTFWRITGVSCRTKPLIPFGAPTLGTLEPLQRFVNSKNESYLSVQDQTTIYLAIQFHRGREHGSDYRIRKIRLDTSPKSLSGDNAGSFATRSFGQEVAALRIPASSSLSSQEIRIQLETEHHESDERKDYPYGPTIEIPVQYTKERKRSIFALLLIISASALFAWAGFSTSTLTSTATVGHAVSLGHRVVAVIIGVIASLYAYYLWSDEIVLDQARRS